MKGYVRVSLNKNYSSFNVYIKVCENLYNIYGFLYFNNADKRIKIQKIKQSDEKLCESLIDGSYKEFEIEDFIMKMIFVYTKFVRDKNNICLISNKRDDAWSCGFNFSEMKKREYHIHHIRLLYIFEILYDRFGYEMKKEFCINLKPNARINFSYYSNKQKKTTFIEFAKRFKSIESCKDFIETKLILTNDNDVIDFKKAKPLPIISINKKEN